MLPLAHTYISTQATGRQSPLLIFGSILPDITTSSLGRINIHNTPKEFTNFISANYPQLTDLGLGVCLHSAVGGGADYYSDDPEMGYARTEGKALSTEVADLLEISKGEISDVLAHNFIETAIDLHLYHDQKAIWDLYNDSLEKVKVDFPKIAACLKAYTGLEEPLIVKELEHLARVLDSYNYISVEAAMSKGALPLIKKRYQKEVLLDQAIKITEQALVITKSSYKEFLDNTVKEVRKNILGS